MNFRSVRARQWVAAASGLAVLVTAAVYLSTSGGQEEGATRASLIDLDAPSSRPVESDPQPPVPAPAQEEWGRLPELASDEEGSDPPHVPRQAVVRGARGSRRADVAAALRRNGARIERRLVPLTDTYLVTVDGPVDRAVRRLERETALLYAEPNFLYQAFATIPSDPSFGQQWGLHNTGQTVGSQAGAEDADIDAPLAWDLTTGSESVVVAVVDTGVASNHPELSVNRWINAGEVAANGVDDGGNGHVDDVAGWDFVDRDNGPLDPNGHGTHVAGTIGAAANNGLPVAGVAWNVRLMSLRALAADGVGTSADLAAALSYAAKNGAHIVNGSFGGSGLSSAIADAIANAPQTIFVFAAGNSGSNNDAAPVYPCANPSANVVCVAASDQNDRLASFSNYGATTVDLTAPGTRILNTAPRLVNAFYETFEEENTLWSSGGVNDTWGRAIDAYGYYLSDSPDGAYANDTDSFYELVDAVPLEAVEECRLTYVIRLASEAERDGVIVEAWSEGTGWARIAGYSGSTSGRWVRMSNALPGSATSIRVRFRFQSDAQNVAEGVDLDDIAIRCLSTSYTGGEVASLSGTSMATPHVAGIFALLKVAAPNATTAELIAELMRGVDPLPELATKTVSGGRADAARPVYAISGQALPEEPSPSPTPTPTPTPSPTSAPPGDGGGGGGGGGGGAPAPTPTATPDDAGPDAGSPDPDAPTPPPEDPPPADETPEPAPPADPGEEPTYLKTITLRLRRHLVARGAVRSEAPEACVSNAPVLIRRGRKVIARTRTSQSGFYKVRLPDRTGRYVARTGRTTKCEPARSVVRRHRHG